MRLFAIAGAEMPSPTVVRIDIYPIKSLDCLSVTTAEVLTSGALQGDRQYALVDRQGRFVNAKREARIHAIRAQFDGPGQSVTLRQPGESEGKTFALTQQVSDLDAWFSDYFGYAIAVRQNLELGFPDDTASPGPTIISTATLEAIASWYPDITDTDDMRRRLRANIEIDGVPAFWEDRLFATADEPVAFRIGDAEFLGINPCQRCVVPTRDPVSGEVYPQFQRLFGRQRQATLPEWSERSRFNHFYRAAVNTRVPSGACGQVVKVGDGLEIA